jgi:hypothetical protein
MKNVKYQIVLYILLSVFLSQSAVAVNSAKKYKLFLDITPKGAKVVIVNLPPDDKYYDNVPLKPGLYALAIKKEGYHTVKTWIKIKNKDVTETITLKKKPAYKLILNVKPENAKIELDGKVKNSKEITLVDKHKLKISCPGYETVNKTIEIKDKDITEFISLEPKLYPLTIKIPATKEESVIKLPSGRHTFEFVRPGYEKKRKTFFITHQPTSHQAEVILTPLHTCDIIPIDENSINIIINKKYTLKFIKIKRSNQSLDIGLREAVVESFYKQATTMLEGERGGGPDRPLIYLSQSKEPTFKIKSDFWIQTETIDSELYKEIIPDGKVDEISYNDAKKFIDTLNKWCKGKPKFDLPDEYEFVHLARQFYNPVKDGQLKKCSQLREEAPNRFSKIFGYKWQLTKSKCQSFNDETIKSIKFRENTYVKKGGSIKSGFATECMPEYRAESLPYARELNTTIRLVFIPKK